MNQDTYNALPGLNHSGIKWLEKSPAHYKAWKDGLITEVSPALELGIAIHSAILEPAKFSELYLSLPDTSHLDTPAQKAALTKAAKKEHQGTDKILLSYQNFNTVLKIREAVMAHPYARYLIEQSEAEQVYTWKDKDAGAACKCRADLVMREQGVLSDLKTTQDASPEAFSQSIAKYRLHRQAAFYLDGCEAQRFNFITVEKQPPYGVVIYTVPAYILEAGRQLYKPLVYLYQSCVESGEWPGYSHDVTTVSLPAWAFPMDN